METFLFFIIAHSSAFCFGLDWVVIPTHHQRPIWERNFGSRDWPGLSTVDAFLIPYHVYSSARKQEVSHWDFFSVIASLESLYHDYLLLCHFLSRPATWELIWPHWCCLQDTEVCLMIHLNGEEKLSQVCHIGTVTSGNHWLTDTMLYTRCLGVRLPWA